MASLKFRKINLGVSHGNVLIKKVSIIRRGLTFEGETREEGNIKAPRFSSEDDLSSVCAGSV